MKTIVVRKLVILLSFMGVLFNEALANDLRQDLVHEVISRSGVKEVVDAFPSLLKAGIRQGATQAGANDPGQLERIDQIVDSAWRPEDIMHTVVATLGEKLSEQQLNDARQWLSSPLGKKITQMEIDGGQLANLEAMEQQLPELLKKFKGSAREKMFDAFDRATGATDVAVDTAIAIQLAMSAAMLSGSERASEQAFRQIRESIESNRFMLRGMIEQQVFNSYIYTYRNLSDNELEAYLAFSQSPSGAKYAQVMHEALKQALIAPAEVVGKNIMRSYMPG
ncbi:MAG: DUF2059 domain-containing protein [Hahellaceae bacterium]|nr:DUF2059 domain-containing protein [Hahellaceae bacterium]MCP5170538.1 DUF2059 domain-containing protein [Hahellaceae bacterium]